MSSEANIVKDLIDRGLQPVQADMARFSAGLHAMTAANEKPSASAMAALRSAGSHAAAAHKAVLGQFGPHPPGAGREPGTSRFPLPRRGCGSACAGADRGCASTAGRAISRSGARSVCSTGREPSSPLRRPGAGLSLRRPEEAGPMRGPADHRIDRLARLLAGTRVGAGKPRLPAVSGETSLNRGSLLRGGRSGSWRSRYAESRLPGPRPPMPQARARAGR